MEAGDEARIPGALAQRYRAAVAHHKAGRLAQARELYEQVLRELPGQPAALHMLGVLLHAQGDPERGVALIEQSIARRPQRPACHNNLGNALRALGRPADAERAYREALRLEPRYATALRNLGVLLSEAGQTEGAAQCFERALELEPRWVEVQLALAASRARQGRLDAAITSFRRALRVDPSLASAYNDLGAVLQMRGEVAAARACFARALGLAPELAQAQLNLARLLDEQDDLDAARAAYERAAALGGRALAAECLCHLASVRRKLCDWSDAEAQRAQLLAAAQTQIRSESGRTLPPLTFNLFAAPAPLRRAVSERYARGIELASAEARARCGFTHARREPEKLRIGYVSPDFRQHAVGTLVAGLFELHDRSGFEIHGYSLVDVDDAFSRRVRAGCDVFVDASRQSPEETARRIHADGIHVLVDLAGYTTYSRTAIFALRPAPVQAHHLGYLDTLGADFIPYVLADACVIPEAAAAHYSEAVVRLPDCFAVAAGLPIAEGTPTRSECGLPEGSFVFCCHNGFQKLDPRSFESWMRILARVPGSVLWLYDGTSATGKRSLARAAAQRGVDPGRLCFAPRLPIPEYLARYRVADLFLDSFDYNAGATALGALAAGLPLLTFAGESFVSRMGASFCHAAGLPELVCGSAQAYEDQAVEIATQPGALAALRRRLAEGHARAPLFDGPRFVRHLELAYRMLWRDHQAGVAPRALRVPASQSSGSRSGTPEASGLAGAASRSAPQKV